MTNPAAHEITPTPDDSPDLVQRVRQRITRLASETGKMFVFHKARDSQNEDTSKILMFTSAEFAGEVMRLPEVAAMRPAPYPTVPERAWTPPGAGARKPIHKGPKSGNN